MRTFIARRLGVSLLVLLTISTLSFVLLKASGDLAISLAGEGSGADYVAFLRKTYGWDRPILVQYADWLWRLLRGDLGTSFYYGSPVLEIIAERLPVTLKLGAFAIFMALGVAFPLGSLAALRPDGWMDRVAMFIAMVGQATPIFWFSFVLILILGLNLAVLPISGGGTTAHFVMPSIALAFYAMPAIIRIVRGGMIEALASDYIRTARAKGLRPWAVIVRHALRNTLVPVVAIASVQFGFLLGGSVVVETIFALHGIGYLTWEAISQNDYPVVQASVLVVSAFYVVLTLLADLLNMLIDPRIRHD
ncbi:MAG: binding-protein-dependent transport system inner rane component [Proteobacteria bacterium]|nr:binding-protein-dependent transport system inner rane component [Pseudomonadota bacterium]